MLSVYDLLIGTAALTKGSALGNDVMMYSGVVYSCIGLYFFAVNCINDCYRDRLYQLMYRLPCIESCIDCICCASCENIRVCFMLKTGCVYHIVTCIYFSVLFVTHAKGDGTCVFFFFLCTAVVICEFRRLCGVCSIDTSFSRTQLNLRSVAVVPQSQPPNESVEIVVEYQLDCEWCPTDEPTQECVKCVCSVCLEAMNGKQVVSNGKCSHLFHATCWTEYTSKSLYNKRCPVCRVAL